GEPHARRLTTRLEAGAVVVHGQLRTTIGSSFERDPTRRGTGVATDVRERLAGDLHDVGRARRELGRHTVVELDDRDHAGSLLELRGDQPQRVRELPIGEDPGSQTEDVVSKITNG